MDRSTQAPNDQNKSRIGSHPSWEPSGKRLSKPTEGYYIVEGENTERIYIRHLDKLNKLKYKIKSFEDDEQGEEKHWEIIDGIKCLKGGDYFSKLNSLEELRDESDDNNDTSCSLDDGLVNAISTTKGSRPYIICIFDLDRCIRNKKEYEKDFNTYKKYLLPKTQPKDYIIFCASMPSIEYWFLLHYEGTDVNKFYKTCKSVKAELIEINSEYSKVKSKKFGDGEYGKECIDYLCADENIKRAKDRAQKKRENDSNRFLDKVTDRMDCNVSYSDMYKLFEIK